MPADQDDLRALLAGRRQASWAITHASVPETRRTSMRWLRMAVEGVAWGPLVGDPVDELENRGGERLERNVISDAVEPDALCRVPRDLVHRDLGEP